MPYSSNFDIIDIIYEFIYSPSHNYMCINEIHI